ncbi:MAG: hypothetical protein HQ478_16315 [Chloroflexi bacterium]|nr:hypothetical protein [Chloroflexota bacterium]
MASQLSSQTIEVADVIAANELFHDRGWSDGLPIIPPTAEAVEEFLIAAGLAADEVLGVEPVKGGVVTAEKAAINAVAAGCRPEYMPVVAAAVRAITTEKFMLHGPTVSTMGAAVLMIVNGPIASDLGMNSGTSVFGPGNRANATIGRAVRLILINVLGTRAGELDKATLGHPGKYSWCIAEAEDRSPWKPLHVERGFDEGTSAVTVVAGLSGLQVGEHAANTPEGILDSFAQRMYALGPDMKEVVLIFCPEHADFFQKANWKKSQIGEYLLERTRKPRSEWAGFGFPVNWFPGQEDDMVSAIESPESVMSVVAGGDGGAWSMIIPTWSFGAKTRSVTHQIT